MIEENQLNTEKDLSIKPQSKIGSLIGIFLILASVSFYVFYLKDLSSEVSSLKTDITSKIATVDELKMQVEELKSAEKDMDLSTEVQVLDILKSIPVGINQDQVIEDLIEISDDSDIELASISFSKGISSKEGINSLRINASFNGNYSDLIGFLEGIEQNARLFKVNSISVQLTRLEVVDILRATFSLSIEAFYQEKK